MTGVSKSLALLCTLGLSGCSPAAVRGIPGDLSVVAEAPPFNVGDEWRYTGGWFVQVVGFEGEYVVTVSNRSPFCQGCRWYHDRNGTVIKVLDAQAKPSQFEAIGLRLLDFPLNVGKEWSQDIDLFEMSSGAVRPYSNQFRIEAYEQVTVKAGTFRAFRISWQSENRGPYGWRGRADLWWSPEVKMFVKRAAHTSGWGQDWELESYSLK